MSDSKRLRAQIVGLFTDSLTSACPPVPAATRAIWARKMEIGCYNYTIAQCKSLGILCTFDSATKAQSAFCGRYSDSAYRLVELLGDPRGEFAARLMSGAISPSGAAGAEIKDLCPSATAHERAEIELRSKQRIDQKISRLFRCAKCGRNETTRDEVMTRRADESCSYRIKCLNCGHSWITS